MAIYKRQYTILCFGDLHSPYQHPDAIDFLKAIKEKYEPDRIINMGDELDNHAINLHMRDPDLPNHKHELDKARDFCQKLYHLFPVMEILDSNHGSLAIRVGKKAGLSSEVIRSPNEILQIPNGWTWHESIEFSYANTEGDALKLHFRHQLKANYLSVGQRFGCCFIQAHYHTKLGVQYFQTPYGLRFAISTGCLIDNDSIAFVYNKANLEMPALGAAIIIGGTPNIQPMWLDKSNRWTGKL